MSAYLKPIFSFSPRLPLTKAAPEPGGPELEKGPD